MSLRGSCWADPSAEMPANHDPPLGPLPNQSSTHPSTLLSIPGTNGPLSELTEWIQLNCVNHPYLNW